MTAPSRITNYPKQGTPAAGSVNATITNTVSTTGSSIASVTVSNTVSVTFSGAINATVTTVTVSNIAQTATFTTSQVTVTASATQLFASGASVNFREVLNPSTVSIFIGSTSSLTVTTGHYLLGSSALDFQFNSSAVWGITSTGSVTVSTIGW